MLGCAGRQSSLYLGGHGGGLACFPVTHGIFASAWPGEEGSSSGRGLGCGGGKRQTWTCEWGPLLLQIINLQWDPSISHRTLKCIPDALKDWILKKKKNQIIEGGKDLNIYQTSGEKRLVKLGSVRKDHRERDGQNWLQKNLAHLYIKTEGRTYAGKNDRRRHYIFST